MRDDSLTLPVLSEAPPIEAGAATLYVLDDGDGTARLYARSDDGSQFELTPPLDVPPTIPALALATAATHGPTSYVSLDVPRSTYLGVAHRDIAVGEVIECAWPQLAGDVGWMEIAVLAGPATAGNPLLGIVAAADVTTMAEISGRPAALVPVTAAIPRGTSLWFVLAVWQPAGSTTAPSVAASVFATHHAAINTVPGWRPTGIGQPAVGWSTHYVTPPPRPVVATVLLP